MLLALVLILRLFQLSMLPVSRQSLWLRLLLHLHAPSRLSSMSGRVAIIFVGSISGIGSEE